MNLVKFIPKSSQLCRGFNAIFVISQGILMAVCSALNCHNTVRKGFVLVRFPKDNSLKEEWISQMGREDWSPNDNSRLCEVHFEQDQWEKYKHGLKEGAVPTLFCSCEQQTADLFENISDYTDQIISDYQYSKKTLKMQSRT